MDPSQTVHLPGFLHTLEPTLNQYGYLAVAGFVLLEDFGVPVPGETILILGAVYAGTGRLSIWLVGLLGFLAAIAGDNIGFAIGHFGGRALVERFGRYVFLTKERLDKTTDFFERRGGWIIIVARFIEGLRQANGIIAGIERHALGDIPRLQHHRRGVVGGRMDLRRLLRRRQHHLHLQRDFSLHAVRGDRDGCPDPRLDRTARVAEAQEAGGSAGAGGFTE